MRQQQMRSDYIFRHERRDETKALLDLIWKFDVDDGDIWVPAKSG